MSTLHTSYTPEGILASLGYCDPMQAARQHVRMILLGRLARYQASVRQMEAKWGCTLEELSARYVAHASEDAALDDGYLQWRWYAEAAETVQVQIDVLAERKEPDVCYPVETRDHVSA